jgi:hypothetical protein
MVMKMITLDAIEPIADRPRLRLARLRRFVVQRSADPSLALTLTLSSSGALLIASQQGQVKKTTLFFRALTIICVCRSLRNCSI